MKDSFDRKLNPQSQPAIKAALEIYPELADHEFFGVLMFAMAHKGSRVGSVNLIDADGDAVSIALDLFARENANVAFDMAFGLLTGLAKSDPVKFSLLLSAGDEMMRFANDHETSAQYIDLVKKPSGKTV